MTAQDLTLNIAVNLGRLSRWSQEGKGARINQFLSETEAFLNQLEKADKKPAFIKTFEQFKKNFNELKSEPALEYEWAEKTLTWCNILTHRAKLA